MKARISDRPGFKRWAASMPIFDDMIAEGELWPADAPWPMRRAQAILQRFRKAFPSLHYDLVWETRMLNAQAFIGEHGRTVRLYGGLGRHRQLGVEGIALAVAHEVGHHLGGRPHHEFYTTISSEARATEWAEEDGLPAVFGEAAGRFATRGQAQLAAVWKRYRRGSAAADSDAATS